MSFGAVVRAKRKALGIGLNDFSERLGVSPAYWSRIERDHEKPPRDELIERAAAILGERLDDLWANARLVVLPSTLEGLSIALLEALAFGRCTIVSDIPENLEVAGDCAVTFRSRDVEDLRRKMQDLIDHPDRMREYEQRARRRIEERFSWDRVVDQLEALYRELA